MMKKILVLSTCLLVLGFMTHPVSAQITISYCKDILEPGNPPAQGTCDIIGDPCTSDADCAGGALTCLFPTLKTWDDVWSMSPGDSIDMDIWANDVPEDLLTAGCYITYDPALINITGVVPNDTANGGPWDDTATNSFEVSPGTWFLALAQFSCVTPDVDGDIFLARATFQCQLLGNVDVTISTIPGFDTVVGCGGTTLDPQITPNIVAIQQQQLCPGGTDPECDDGLYCNGAETCVANVCQPGTPPDCDDGVACTDDTCDEAGDTCVNTPNDANCDDGVSCTDDTCDAALDCQATPNDANCDDGVSCTDDTCDAALDCQATPNDANCDDGISCTDDICDAVQDCQAVDNCPTGQVCDIPDTQVCIAPPCSISLTPATPTVGFLGTVQFDVVIDGTCLNPPSYTWEISDTGCTGDATGSGIGSTIDETGRYTADTQEGSDTVRVTDDANGDICATADVTVVSTTTTTVIPPTTTSTVPSGECTEDADCDDGVACTDDTCVDATCEYTPNDDNCPDDGLYCNGEEFCDAEAGCSSTGDPCGAGETCDEETDSCTGTGACAIDVLRDSLPKSHWAFIPVVFRIEAAGIEGLNALTPVTIACESDGMGSLGSNAILQLLSVPLPSFGTNTTVILQSGIILPAWLTGSQEMESETCTVTVGDCPATDTFELNYLNLGGIPLSE